jgi:hypothetical protein
MIGLAVGHQSINPAVATRDRELSPGFGLGGESAAKKDKAAEA